MDSVQCTGTETRLSQCSFGGWGEEDCSHSQDVGVVCNLGEVVTLAQVPFSNR